MKRCPTCERIYTDETLNFCLEDGASLQNVSSPGRDATLVLDPNEPPPTEILDPALAPTLAAAARKPQATVRQQARSTRNEYQDVTATAPASPPRKTSSVVALTAVATILLLALGGLGAWLLLKDDGAGKNGNTGTDVTRGGGDGNTNMRPSPSPTIEDDGGVMTPTPTPSPTATPTPTPQQTPQITDATAVRREVASALGGWRQTMINPSVDAHMSYYASVLHTYYNARNVDVGRVRSNVARAFSSYSTFDVQITNLQIEVDPSGQKAVATFDKTFEFRNDAKRYAGSGLNRFWFEKIGGRWLITGEKDLKTYYINN
jgi:hypothetical protein